MNQRPTHPLDYTLLVSVLLLMAIGVMAVYSASAIMAEEKFHDSFYFLKREITFTALAICILFLTKSINYHLFYKLPYVLLFISLVLLILTFIPGLGEEVNGAQRWIRLGGFSLQPSEMAKFAVICFMAYALTKKGEKINQLTTGLLPTVAIAGLFAGVVLLQKDLGTAVVIAGIIFFMLYFGGVRLHYLLAGVFSVLPVLYFAIFNVPYRRERLMCFMDPFKEARDCGHQIIQSYVAFSSGGLTGMGLGQGKQKLGFLPEGHTDFIFPMFAEEMGLIGSLVVMLLLLILMWRGMKISLNAPDRFGMLMAGGITCMLTLQTLFNLAVVMGLLPTKGLPLPFLSHGGTFLLVVAGMIGVLLNISAQARRA